MEFFLAPGKALISALGVKALHGKSHDLFS